MIEISTMTAFTCYISITLAIILGIWFFQFSKKKQKEKSFPPEKKLLTCEYCNFAYLDYATKKLSKCPQCKFLNKNESKDQTNI